MTGHFISHMIWFLCFAVFTSYVLGIVIYNPFALQYVFLSIFAAFAKLYSATVKKNPTKLHPILVNSREIFCAQFSLKLYTSEAVSMLCPLNYRTKSACKDLLVKSLNTPSETSRNYYCVNYLLLVFITFPLFSGFS